MEKSLQQKENKGLNKKKSFLRKMIDFANAKSLNMMVLLVVGYFWYKIFNDTIICFRESCLDIFLTFKNISNIIFLIMFTIFVIKMLQIVMKEDEEIKEINKLTKDNLIKDKDIKDLEKEKLQLEIEKLKLKK